MNYAVISLACFALLFACGQNGGKESTGQHAVETETTVMQQAQKAELKRQIIFFTPSTDELMLMMDGSDEENSITEAIADFEFYASAFQQNPGRTDLGIRFSDSKEILLTKNGSTFKFSRTTEQPFGIIMSDGQKEPLIDCNVRLDSEIKDMALGYFGTPAN